MSRGDDARILVVDDDRQIRRVLGRLLDRQGLTSDEAENAAAARELLSRMVYDLVLCDLNLPGESGLDLAASILRDKADTAVVMVTGADDTELAKRALEMGAYGYVIKPFAPNEILINVVNALRRRELEIRQRAHTEELERKVAERTESLRQSLEVLRSVDEQRRALLANMVRAQEEERARIAGEIHDDSIQVMAAATMRLEMVRRKIDDPAEAEAVRKLEDTVRLAVQRLRRLIFDLRPRTLDKEGVGPALKLCLEQMREDSGIDCELADETCEQPPHDVSTILYRLAQEALANVRKHSNASRVLVGLMESDGGFLLTVSDDGVGFSPEKAADPLPGHMGIPSMHERALLAGGWCKIDSEPSRGARVEVWLPAETVPAGAA